MYFKKKIEVYWFDKGQKVLRSRSYSNNYLESLYILRTGNGNYTALTSVVLEDIMKKGLDLKINDNNELHSIEGERVQQRKCTNLFSNSLLKKPLRGKEDYKANIVGREGSSDWRNQLNEVKLVYNHSSCYNAIESKSLLPGRSILFGDQKIGDYRNKQNLTIKTTSGPQEIPKETGKHTKLYSKFGTKIVKMSEKRQIGQFKFFHFQKEYGFITIELKDKSTVEDIFCHMDDLKKCGITKKKIAEMLAKRIKISFDWILYSGNENINRKAVNFEVMDFI